MMPKTLYLVRHAQAAWGNTPDFDRSLTPHGKAEAMRMGQRLAKRQIQPDALMSSTAQRALSTTQILADNLQHSNTIHTESNLYLASAEHLLQHIQNFNDNWQSVMLIAHNPGMSVLCEQLTRNAMGGLPTAGIFCVDVAVDTWQAVCFGSGIQQFYDYP